MKITTEDDETMSEVVVMGNDEEVCTCTVQGLHMCCSSSARALRMHTTGSAVHALLCMHR